MGWSGHGLVHAPASLPRKIFKQKEETTFMREYNIKRGKTTQQNRELKEKRAIKHTQKTKQNKKKDPPKKTKQQQHLEALFFRIRLLCSV